MVCWRRQPAAKRGNVMGVQRHNGRRAVLFVLCAGTLPLYPGAAAAADADSQTQMSADMSSPPEEPEQVTITGSRLRAAQTQSAQDVRIYERPRIEQSG